MIVIVCGYEGSGPGHWQHWLFEQLQERATPALFPHLPDPNEPECEVWVAALAAIVAEHAPVTFVAHSLGCWAVDHYLKRHGAAGVHAALLVAPPSPFSIFEPIQSFLPPPRDRQSWEPLRKRTLLIGSNNDDHAGEDEIIELGERLHVETRILEGVGHINAAAGFGPFPLALAWLDALPPSA